MSRILARSLAVLAAMALLALPFFGLAGESNPPLTSTNWAGYFIPAGSYQSVGGQWTMPRQILDQAQAGTLSIWLGLQASPHLIQGGTAQVDGSLTTTYLFWENYPATLPEDNLPGSDGQTFANNQIAAYIRKDGLHSWALWIEDLATGRVLTATVNRAHLGLSLQPEWMVEDSGNSPYPLLPFTPIQFSRLTVNGAVAGLNADDAESESMAQGTTTYATTSSPSSNDNGFAVGFSADKPSPKPGPAHPQAAIDVAAPLTLSTGQVLTILGGGFGEHKGQVLLEGHSARILNWRPGIIRVLAPKVSTPRRVDLAVVSRSGIHVRFDGIITLDP